MWPPPGFQFLPNFRSPTVRLRINYTQGEVVTKQGIRQMGCITSTPPTGIWGGWCQWRKQTPPLPSAVRRSRPNPKYVMWVLSELVTEDYNRLSMTCI